jgi:hypothetical protein
MSKYTRPWLDWGGKGTFQSYPSRINKGIFCSILQVSQFKFHADWKTEVTLDEISSIIITKLPRRQIIFLLNLMKIKNLNKV